MFIVLSLSPPSSLPPALLPSPPPPPSSSSKRNPYQSRSLSSCNVGTFRSRDDHGGHRENGHAPVTMM
eukprot:6512902-Pyramimonas_sp.AAC.1